MWPFTIIFVIRLSLYFITTAKEYNDDAIKVLVSQSEKLTLTLEKVAQMREKAEDLYDSWHEGIDERKAGERLAEATDFHFNVPTMNPLNSEYTPDATENAMLEQMKTG